MSYLKFSDLPGAHERHVRRKSNNPLFLNSETDSEQLNQARVRDLEDVQQFNLELESTVKQCLNLKAHADSGEVLILKEKLDQLYERCCGLAGERSLQKQSIKDLVAPIMHAIEKGASTDPIALKKLEDENVARQLHFQLLENPLICDLLRPDSPIATGDLAATLLSEPEKSLSLVLDLFDENQLLQIFHQSRALLNKQSPEAPLLAHKNLQIIEQHTQQTVH